jgi:hypothetical protein
MDETVRQVGHLPEFKNYALLRVIDEISLYYAP